jgi:hypothetical protein
MPAGRGRRSRTTTAACSSAMLAPWLVGPCTSASAGARSSKRSPGAGLDAARHHLELFLVQHWGGPAVYREARGEGRLTQRHRRFSIGAAERDAWLGHMRGAVRQAGASPLDELQIISFFESSASTLVNRP